MSSSSNSLIYFTIFILLSSLSLYKIGDAASPDIDLQTYIIQVKQPDTNNTKDIESWYRSFLPRSSSPDRLIHIYTEIFSGFSAKLTKEEVKEMGSKPGFIQACDSIHLDLHTTHTPDFLDLTGPTGLWNTSSNLGEGAIIGVIDTGILPNHPSFSDKHVPPPPKKWKGVCGFQNKTSCNNKLIGARSLVRNEEDPTDNVGHGTHVSSIAAGNFVEDVDFFGLGSQTMSGVAPHAHLATYKVCSSNSSSSVRCALEDVLAGMDAAVKDGVDVLSISLGASANIWYYNRDEDPLTIATFAAVHKKGVIVVGSAGNYGPVGHTVRNDAHWILTVAASSVDRNFRSVVKLGNGKEYYGEGLYKPSSYTSTAFPLTLLDTKTTCDLAAGNKGNITVCLDHPPTNRSLTSGTGLTENIGTASEGIIRIHGKEEGYTISLARSRGLPSSQVTWKDGLEIISYINSTKNTTTTATGMITFKHAVLGVSPSRVIASFSSRGEGQYGIIPKPDISAPGLNIIAAWNSVVENSGTKFPINVQSGTSMATAHVSGVAALLKSMHPDWSPAMIKSAIMTSSYYEDSKNGRILDEQHANATYYASGAGFISPMKAIRPGLVYDLGVDNYCNYLCGEFGVGPKRASARFGCNCSNTSLVRDWELNYPTIIIPGYGTSTHTTVVNRTVINVGIANATYVVEVDHVPEHATVAVEPTVMQFHKAYEKKSFSVRVTSYFDFEATLKWISGDVVLRSTIVVRP